MRAARLSRAALIVRLDQLTGPVLRCPERRTPQLRPSCTRYNSDTWTWSVWLDGPEYELQPLAGNQICRFQIT
ncbi:hypothetical protein TPA0907_48350 [Micromonospora humidisoli]|nr:hypothetical protein TPA0907_48350 [Micromonospora sp. AKA109]